MNLNESIIFIYFASLSTLLNKKSALETTRGVSYHFFSTCVSRCPPRSFPNQGGVCWPCHESCEICAGAGQDSCLSCAPAHLRVTDLAVCLQQCPEGYYESTWKKNDWFIFYICARISFLIFFFLKSKLSNATRDFCIFPTRYRE